MVKEFLLHKKDIIREILSKEELQAKEFINIQHKKFSVKVFGKTVKFKKENSWIKSINMLEALKIVFLMVEELYRYNKKK